MGLFTIFVIAVGLAMDSFAVSIAGGVSLKNYRISDAIRTGLFMGIGQALFFAIGFYLASTVAHLIHAWDHWIALILLSGIGIKMILERNDDADDHFVDLRRKRILLTLAVATSIDALAVGISFSFLHYDISTMLVLVGGVSFVFSAVGVYLGAFVSQIKRFPTCLIGGVLLIAIGIKIVIEHLVNHI